MSQLKTNSIANVAGTASTDVLNVINGSAKAWVNFNPAGGAINASYNVSSVTDNGTADYTVSFASAMIDANYIAVGFDQYQRHCNQPTVTKTTTAHRMANFANDANGASSDLIQGWFAYFR